MTYEEKLNLAVEKFLNEEETLGKLKLQLKLPNTKVITERLEELGYRMYSGAKASSVKNLKAAVEEYILEYANNPSITKIATKYKIGRAQLSNRLKELGYEVINHQNKLKFDETIFDSIDTEEKAYWLGFIFADGYISSTPLEEDKKSSYQFELSLKADDSEHLHKFNKFMKHKDNIVKINDVKCNGTICKRCRWGVNNKHLWTALNNKGCTPRKSLTLEFPNINIFKDESLIRHFIRGYWDGDGCLSWSDHDHKRPHVSALGTEDFLTEMKKYLPLKFNYILGYNDKHKNTITRVLSVVGRNGYDLAKYLYSNATIYLDRKYEKYLEYCRLYEESYKELSGNIGETPEMDNTEINLEIKESESSYSVEVETCI